MDLKKDKSSYESSAQVKSSQGPQGKGGSFLQLEEGRASSAKLEDLRESRGSKFSCLSI